MDTRWHHDAKKMAQGSSDAALSTVTVSGLQRLERVEIAEKLLLNLPESAKTQRDCSTRSTEANLSMAFHAKY